MRIMREGGVKASTLVLVLGAAVLLMRGLRGRVLLADDPGRFAPRAHAH